MPSSKQRISQGIRRRGFLTGAAAAGAGTALGTGLAPAASAASGSGSGGGATTAAAGAAYGPFTVPAGDPRYDSLLRGYNQRFAPSPDYVRVVSSPEQVVAAIEEAVAAGKRLVVRSGGHCSEDFTATPDVEVLVDLSEMDEVAYDESRRAFVVQSGATLGHVYRALFKGWGVTVPAGTCPDVGVGGHIAGGGYGTLSRTYGLVIDHLYAVEAATVTAAGQVRLITATREPDDPHRELWWAHTGGGGGSFGVVTRYWLRSPEADGGDPSRLLPPAPAYGRVGTVIWPWESLDEAAFTALVRNHHAWFEANSAPGQPEANLSGGFFLTHASGPGLAMDLRIDDGVPGAERIMTEHVQAITAGTVAPAVHTQEVRPWLDTMVGPGAPDVAVPGKRRMKTKAAYLRRSYTEAQIAALHRHLTREDFTNPDANVFFAAYGGQINAVAPDATASAQRDSILKVVFGSVWGTEAEDAANEAWLREFYADVYADSGGVPVPGERNDGSYINYADNDLADPAHNASGTPWTALYWKDNYPRLQRVKERYDPRDTFHHALSVRLP
jgi:aclacinomycin oxidase